MRISTAAALGGWVALLWLSAAYGHEIRPAIATIELAPEHYRVELIVNAEALLARIGPGHADTDDSPDARVYNALRTLPPADLQQRFRAYLPDFLPGIEIRFDGGLSVPRVEHIDIPEVGDLARSRRTRIVLVGEVPANAGTMTWRYAAAYGSSVVKLRRSAGEAFVSAWLKPGVESEPYRLSDALPSEPRATIAWQYLMLGFTHIVPKGLDHILFVLGLFLLSASMRPLLWQVTSFTVAHSITLGLSIYGYISLSSAIVEPLIALSIVYVAIENILTPRLHPWRLVIVFAFGLLHGMGFAGVLQELGLPRSQFLTALVTFNLGVEFGQLAVIAGAYLAVGIWGRNRDWYRRWVVIPASAVIAVVGLHWTVDRVWPGALG